MTEKKSIPRIGMMCGVRNRRGIISSVEARDQGEGLTHVVRVSYLDQHGSPEDYLLWEIEESMGGRLFEPRELPKIEKNFKAFFPHEYDALIRSARWTSLSPIPELVGANTSLGEVVTAPFFGAIQVDDYQMEPLFRALKMPRVSLLIADDVGLGKTIEAGLVLTELIRKRRIQKVLILTPASLRYQWKEELQSKFSLSFEVVDRDFSNKLKKEIGMTATPWKSFSKVISSYHYLKQFDILEEFLTSVRKSGDGARLPWDLLIVDEAHNLMPPPFGEESDLTKLLRTITPYFEHKIFLTATPHNGYTESFTGLLELLDPVKYTKTNELSTQDVADIWKTTGVRRLKREINQMDREMQISPRFPERKLVRQEFDLYKEEKELFLAFSEFRSTVRQKINSNRNGERNLGFFVLEILNKRLLSSTVSFYDSWQRFINGFEESDTSLEESGESLAIARNSALEEVDDDRELESKLALVSGQGGGWFQNYKKEFQKAIERVDTALRNLNFKEGSNFPKKDSKLEELEKIVLQNLKNREEWIPGERLIIFTEYKTTLDYLQEKLHSKFGKQDEIQILYGGLEDSKRDEVRTRFNDPNSTTKILVATDAASEGLNLQETAHRLLHFDIPWNPSRLEQRNGRLDRHGQANDVFVYHFSTKEESDLKFLSRVLEKVNTMRDDLGVIGELFDKSFQRRFQEEEDSDRIINSIEEKSKKFKNQDDVHRDTSSNRNYSEAIEFIKQEADINPNALFKTVNSGLSLPINPPFVLNQDPTHPKKYRISGTINSQLERDVKSDLYKNPESTARPAVTFDPEFFMQKKGSRSVFRDSSDTVMLHLGHRLFHKIMSFFNQYRFPDAEGSMYPRRWTLKKVKQNRDNAKILLLLTIEELAINELKEPVHHWIRTYEFSIQGNSLGEPLKPRSAKEMYDEGEETHEFQKIYDLWATLEGDVDDFLKKKSKELNNQVTEYLKKTKDSAVQIEKKNFEHRIKVLEKAKQENTLDKLNKRIETVEEQIKMGFLFTDLEKDLLETRKNLESEVERRETLYSQQIDFIKREMNRILNKILPGRFTLSGNALIYPVGIEFRVEGESL